MAKFVILTLTLLAVANASVIRKLTPAQAERLANWKEADKQNVWELSGQYQGDIILNDKQRNGLISERYRWPNNTIPYVFDPLVTEEQREYIEKTLKVFEEVSCVKTKPKTSPEEGNYVYITNENSGCWSYVGRQGSKQQLNLQSYDLGTGCFRPATIVHEFLHAFGFFHQQSSHDRDEYVQIKWDNILKGTEGNFEKYSNREVSNFGEKYDYGSVMHYGEYAFSSNGERTIVPKDPTAQIGQRDGISPIDIAKLNSMYACDLTTKN